MSLTDEEYNKILEEEGPMAARKAERDSKRAENARLRAAKREYNKKTTGSAIRSPRGEDEGFEGLTDAMKEAYALQAEANQAFRPSNIRPGRFGPQGLDYLTENYTPENNPFDPRSSRYVNPVMEARRAVAETRQQQLADKQLRDMEFQRTGMLTEGDTTYYANNPLLSSRGFDFATINIPYEYSPNPSPTGLSNAAEAARRNGGLAYGSNVVPLNLPTGDTMLPTQYDNIEMSAEEAFNMDNMGNGIYNPVDRRVDGSNAAAGARRGATQTGINERIAQHYNTRVPNQNMAPAPSPSGSEFATAEPSEYNPIERERRFQTVYDYIDNAGIVLDNELVKGIVDLPEFITGTGAALIDYVNAYIANPVTSLITGETYYSGDEAKDAAFNLFNPPVNQ